MHDSVETNDSLICHTTNMTCLSVCQSRQPSANHTVMMTCLSICQTYIPPVHHTIMMTSPSIHQSYITSDHHTDLTTSPSVCQSCQSSVRCTIEPTHLSICNRQYISICHTINTTSPSVCQTDDTSVCHAMKTNSLYICQPHDTSIHHTNIMISPSICPSDQLSDHHTTTKTSLSLCQSHIPSVCHNVIPTSPSVCPLQDSSVCYLTCDIIIPPVWLTVCSSSVTSVLPSANPMVKMPTSTPVRNFPHDQNPGKFPFICTSMDSSVHHTDSPSINSSLSAASPTKIPCNYGERNAVKSLHKSPLKSPPINTSCDTSVIAPVHASSIQPIHTSCDTSVIAPVRALPILSVLPYDDECQDFLDGFPGTKYGEKNLSKIMVKFPHDITLTLQQAKFLEETPDTTKRVLYPGNFMLT